MHRLQIILLLVAVISPFFLTLSSASICNVNGCTRQLAEESSEILFPTNDGITLAPEYFPNCITVPTGSSVTFSSIFIATFSDHPLRGGVYDEEADNITWTTDSSSPLFETFDDPEQELTLKFTNPVRN